MYYKHYKPNIRRCALLFRNSGVQLYFCDVILNKVMRVALLTDRWCGSFSDFMDGGSALLVISCIALVLITCLWKVGNVAVPKIIPKVMDTVTIKMLSVTPVGPVARRQATTSPVTWHTVYAVLLPALENSIAAR